MDKPVKVLIKTLSPIHIGCDEVYEPTSFVLDEKNLEMTVFDPMDFIAQINDKDKKTFSQICMKGTVRSILELYRFMRNRTADGRRIAVCRGLIEHYNQTLSLSHKNNKLHEGLNQFEISRTAYLANNQQPYIPSSSVKGAIRTAYLNLMESEKRLSGKKVERNSENLEKKLLDYSGIPSDPFRMVKVSDFLPVDKAGTKIMYGINLKKKQSLYAGKGLPVLLEVIPEGTLFEGTVTVSMPLKRSGIKKPVLTSKLFKSLNTFYKSEKTRENDELRTMGMNVAPEYYAENKDSVFLTRIGRHSGAEAVTIEGYRNIFIKGVNKRSNKASTIWLASATRKPVNINDLQPFGWVSFKLKNADDIVKQVKTKTHPKIPKTVQVKKPPSLSSLKSLQEKWKKS